MSAERSQDRMTRPERWFLYASAGFIAAFVVFLIVFTTCLALGRV